MVDPNPNNQTVQETSLLLIRYATNYSETSLFYFVQKWPLENSPTIGWF